MNNNSKTIQEISEELDYKSIPNWSGNPLELKYLTRDEVSTLKVDDNYQRLISPSKLQQYGQLNFNLLIPAVISSRPENMGDFSGNYIIDGQHKAEKYYRSGHNGDGKLTGFPVTILTHDDNCTYKEVLEKEAKLFQALNTIRKKLTRIDELRSELVYGDKYAVHIHSIMKLLNVVCDNFGSNEKDAKKVKSFSHFQYTIEADYSHDTDGMFRIKSGYDLWKQIYKNDDVIHGTAFRAICFLERFISEGLTNGIQAKLKEWCVNELSAQFNQEKLVKGYGSFDSPRWILYRIIDKYNDWMTNKYKTGAPTIKEKRLLQAVQSSQENRFQHPDEEMWKKIVEIANKS